MVEASVQYSRQLKLYLHSNLESSAQTKPPKATINNTNNLLNITFTLYFSFNLNTT